MEMQEQEGHVDKALINKMRSAKDLTYVEVTLFHPGVFECNRSFAVYLDKQVR